MLILIMKNVAGEDEEVLPQDIQVRDHCHFFVPIW